MKRAIFDIVLFLSIFLFPWWIVLGLACIGIFLFIDFYEFVAAAVIVYSLYIIPGTLFLTKPIWFCLILSVVYIGIQVLRQYIILYRS